MKAKKKPPIRWYCKECKQSIIFDLTEEFKKKFLKAANNIFPYPVIIAHRGHYTIVHLDSQFQDRGTLLSKILINLNI